MLIKRTLSLFCFNFILMAIAFLFSTRHVKSELIMQKRWAFLNLTIFYRNVNSADKNSTVTEVVKNVLLTDSALYGLNSPSDIVSGPLVVVKSIADSSMRASSDSSNSSTDKQVMINSNGCSKYVNTNLPSDYIALVSRGECTFETKIQVAVENKAIGIIIYNTDEDLFTMLTRATAIPNVFIPYTVGNLIVSMSHNARVLVSIEPGPIEIIENNSLPSKVSIYFVAVAFVIVVIVTLVWITVYYIQKYRYYNSKKRLDNKLKKATQRAMTKMKINELKGGENELNEVCAICLENYQVGDSTRELPCGHYFHQKDIDVWLMKNRTCPMCKINVLQAYGIEINKPKGVFRRVVERVLPRPFSFDQVNPSRNNQDPENQQYTQSMQQIVQQDHTVSEQRVNTEMACSQENNGQQDQLDGTTSFYNNPSFTNTEKIDNEQPPSFSSQAIQVEPLDVSTPPSPVMSIKSNLNPESTSNKATASTTNLEKEVGFREVPI